MSETMALPPLTDAYTKKTPTVYFIDDSATMREVIKIAFRRENFNVITCADAASALAQFEQNPPDAVITDVIMTDTDGYSVCTQVKQHAQFGHIPVVLMSGVVNKTVADKAVSVKADELIRKPFQPLDLIARVKSFLEPKPAPPVPAAPVAQTPRAPSRSPLSTLFALQAPANVPPSPPPAAVIPAAEPRRESAWPAALANAFQPQSQPPATTSPFAPPAANFVSQTSVRPPASAGDIQKLKTEISRLELLIKKLQTELQIERQYNQALELHVKSLTSIE